jgi:hypothetical protein
MAWPGSAPSAVDPSAVDLSDVDRPAHGPGSTPDAQATPSGSGTPANHTLVSP